MNNQPTGENRWVTMWANATSLWDCKPPGYARDITLRYPIYNPCTGNKVRITLSNYCGTEPVTINRTSIGCFADNEDNMEGKGQERKLDLKLSCPVLFNGSRQITIPAGEEAVSDEILFPVNRGRDFCISLYLKDFTQMRSTVLVNGPLSTAEFALGNHVEEEVLPLNERKATNWFYFLNQVEVYTDIPYETIVCYGDSITTGDWPDDMNLLLKEKFIHNKIIVRRAVSGTRVLRQYDCVNYASYGLKGENRFTREVKNTGAERVLIQHGINDIIHPVGVEVNPYRPWEDLPTLEELTAGLDQYVKEAKALGMEVYMGTLIPIKGWRTYAPFREELRQEVNQWIRENREIAGCVDFDEALRNSEDTEAFQEGFDSGDHLHPSKSAYRQMAATAAYAMGLLK